MLSELTQVSLARRWAPRLYKRLANQLRDVGGSKLAEKDALDVLLRLLADHQPPDPLLLEYIVVLAADPQSVLPFRAWLEYWAQSPTLELGCQGLVAYAARGSVLWHPRDAPAADQATIVSALSRIVDYVLDNHAEFRFLVAELSRNGFVAELAASRPEWRASLAELCRDRDPELFSLLLIGGSGSEKPKTPAVSVPADPSADRGGYIPSRSLRLYWLDWIVQSAICPDMTNFRHQIEVLWPRDRDLVVAYELCLTAFECYTAATSRRPLWATWIVKRLPLVLESLGKSGSERLDGAVARVFTTMDKDLAQTADNADLRTCLGQALADIGVCDPTVLHTLHRSYEPQTEPAWHPPQPQDLLSVVNNFGSLGPRGQEAASHWLMRLVRTSRTPHSRVAALCSALIRDLRVLDACFVHAPALPFVEGVMRHADALAVQEGANSTVYADFGTLVTFVDVVVARFDVPTTGLSSANSTMKSWRRFLDRTAFTSAVSDLDWEQAGLMGKWVTGLYSGTTGGSGGNGLADDALRSPRQLFPDVIPALIHQSAEAYHSAVIDHDTLASGLDYFLQPFLVPCLGLVMRVLREDVFQRLHVDAVLEMVRILVKGVADRRQEPSYAVAAVAIAPVARQIIEEAQQIPSSSTKKLTDSVGVLVTSLEGQPLTSRTVISGSATDFVISAVKSAVAWQVRSVGVPPIPCWQLRAAKPVLGASRTREIVEQTGDDSDVVVSLLAMDALAADETDVKLVDTPGGDPTVMQLARDIATRIRDIVESAIIYEEEIDHDFNEIDITEQNPANHVSQESVQPPNPATRFGDGVESHESSAPPPPASNDMLDEFNYEMDMDGQPMDLAALDSAMDMGWG